MHSTPLIPSSRSGSPLANARIPSGTDAQITALDPLLDRICPILESLPRVSRRSLPPRGAASVIASYLPEQSAQVPPIFNGLRYAHPGLHPRPSSPTSGVVKRAFIFALSLIHISEPTRRTPISYAVFCLKKKQTKQ